MNVFKSISVAILKPLQVHELTIIGGAKKRPVPWDKEPYVNNNKINEFVRLEKLTIRGYEFDNFDFDFDKLPNLTYLDISYNDFGYWLYMPRMEAGVDLKGTNHIPYVGANFYKQKNLEYFNFAGNRLGYVEFPDGAFPKLQELDLSDNAREYVLINQYDEEVLVLNLPFLPALKRLNLDSNQLSDFPNIFHLKTLEHLHLNYNKIASIPNDIKQLVNLKTLILSSNLLESFPENLNLPHLESLFLNNNQLWWIGESIQNSPQLKNLDLSANLIEEIPASLLKLSNLEQLNLANNKLTELPVKLHQLKKLKQLDLRGNNIPQESIEAFKTKRPDVAVDSKKEI